MSVPARGVTGLWGSVVSRAISVKMAPLLSDYHLVTSLWPACDQLVTSSNISIQHCAGVDILSSLSRQTASCAGETKPLSPPALELSPRHVLLTINVAHSIYCSVSKYPWSPNVCTQFDNISSDKSFDETVFISWLCLDTGCALLLVSFETINKIELIQGLQFIWGGSKTVNYVSTRIKLGGKANLSTFKYFLLNWKYFYHQYGSVCWHIVRSVSFPARGTKPRVTPHGEAD